MQTYNIVHSLESLYTEALHTKVCEGGKYKQQ